MSVWVSLLIVAAPAAAQSEREPILAVVQELFDAMAARDTARLNAVLLPGGQFVVMRPGEDGGLAASVMTFGEFAERLQRAEAPWVERFWDAQVLAHGPLAVVWTPYDFHLGRAFSHCGVDAFTLARTATGWQISGGSYTVEPRGCPPGQPRPHSP